MINIKKNEDWFLVKSNNTTWSCESTQDVWDFGSCSTEKLWKSCKNNTCFDWPWDYEKNETEIKWVEINDKWVTSFGAIMWKTSLNHLPENLWELNDTFLDNMNDSDILLVSVWENSEIKSLKSLIDKIDPRIIIFGWSNPQLMQESYPGCESLEELKVGTLPADKSEYYILE